MVMPERWQLDVSTSNGLAMACNLLKPTSFVTTYSGPCRGEPVPLSSFQRSKVMSIAMTDLPESPQEQFEQLRDVRRTTGG